MTSPLLTDDATAPQAEPSLDNTAALRPDPSWLTRHEICAAHGLSLRALRRWRKDGLVERHCQDRQTFYRLTQAPPAPAPTEPTEPETDQAWMDVIPIRTGRRQPEAPRQGEPARLAALLKLAIEQRDAAIEAQKQATAAQDALSERLDGLQQRFDEALRQRDELMLQRKRLQGERDELARKLTLAIRQRDAAIVARAEAVHRSDELSCELNLANAERDKLVRRREALIARLDRTVQQREYAHRQLQQAHHLLTEWQTWRDQAEETLRASDDRTLEALKLAAAALRTPWWGVSKRRELHSDLQRLLKGQ